MHLFLHDCHEGSQLSALPFEEPSLQHAWILQAIPSAGKTKSGTAHRKNKLKHAEVPQHTGSSHQNSAPVRVC